MAASGGAVEKAAAGMTNAFTAIKVALAGLGIQQLGSQLIDASVQFQRMSTTLNIATGSLSKSANEMAFVRAESGRLGLAFLDAGQSFAKLALVGGKLGLSLTEVRTVFSGVGSAAAVMGLTAEQQKGAFLALEQMLSKGTVQAEELRGQLGERIPGAVEDMAKALGMTLPQMNKALQNGQVEAGNAVLKLGAYWKQIYGNQIPSAMDAVNMAMNDFGNRITDIKLEIGKAGFLETFTHGLVALSSALGDPSMLSAAHAFGESFKTITKNADLFAAAIGGLVTTGVMLKFIQLLREMTIIEGIAVAIFNLTDPIILLAAAIGGVVAAAVYFNDKFIETGTTLKTWGDITKQVMGNAWEATKAFFDFIIENAAFVVNALMGIGSALNPANWKVVKSDKAALGFGFANDTVDGFAERMSTNLDNVAKDASIFTKAMTGEAVKLKSSYFDSINDQIKDMSANFTKLEQQQTKDLAAGINNKPKPAPGPTEEQLKKLNTEYEKLLKELNPIQSMIREQAKEQKQLDDIFKAHIITRKEYLALTAAHKVKAQEDLYLTKEIGEEFAKQDKLVTERITSIKQENEYLALEVAGRKDLIPLLKAENELKAQRSGRDLSAKDKAELADQLLLQRGLNLKLEEQAKLVEQQKKDAQAWQKIWDHAIEGIQDSMTKMFRSVLDKGLDGFHSFGASLIDLFKDIASQIATLLVFKPIVGGILSSIGFNADGTPSSGAAGGMSSGLMAGVTGASLSNLVGGQASKFSLQGLGNWFATTGVGESLGLSTTINAANGFGGYMGTQGARVMTGAGAGLSSALKASPWGIVGSLAASLVGLKGTGNMVADLGLGVVGSVGGAAAGSAALGTALGSAAGPVGAIIGAFLAQALGSLFGSKPSDKTGGYMGSLIDGSQFQNTGNPQGSAKYSSENDKAARTIFDTVSSITKAIMSGTGASLDSHSVFRVDVGSRDGTRARFGDSDWKTYGTPEELLADVTKTIIGSMSGLPQDIKTALDHIDWTGDLQKAGGQLEFAKNFQANLRALSTGVEDFSKSVQDQASVAIVAVTQQIKDFKKETADLGLDTDAAAAATKSFVEVLLGLKDNTQPQSPLAVALATLEGQFAVIGPLLDEVGIGADKAGTLLASAKEKLFAGFQSSLEDQLLQLKDPQGAELATLDKWREDQLVQAAIAGRGVATIEEIYGIKRAAIVKKYADKAVADTADSLGKVSDLVQKAYADQIDAINGQIEANKALISTYTSNIDSLRRTRLSLLIDPNLSPLSPEQRLNEARSQFGDILTKAKLGDQNAIAELPDITKQFLEASRSYYASSEGYFQDFQMATDALQGVETSQDRLLGVANAQLATQQGILAALQRGGAAVGIQGLPGSTPPAASYTTAQLDANSAAFNAAYLASGAATPGDYLRGAGSFWVGVRDQGIAGLQTNDASWINSMLGHANDQIASPDLAQFGVGFSDNLRKRAHELGIPGFATGGIGSGIAMVGENGPELVNLGGMAQVFSNEESNNMFSGVVTAIGRAANLNAEGQKLIIGELRGIRGVLEDIKAQGTRNSGAPRANGRAVA